MRRGIDAQIRLIDGQFPAGVIVLPEGLLPCGRRQPVLAASGAVHLADKRHPVAVVPHDLLAAKITGPHAAMVDVQGVSR